MILWRYFAREFAKNLAVLVVFLSGLYIVIDFLEKNTRYFPKYNTPNAVIAEYYFVQIPKLVSELSPFATLFAAIITLWSLAKSGEIAAMRAAGMSVFRVCSPILALGMATSLGIMALDEFVVPRAMMAHHKIERVKIEGSQMDRIFLDSNWVRGDDSILRFRRLDPINRRLLEPEYFVLSSPSRLKQMVHAREASFDESRRVWTLHDAVVTELEAPEGKLVQYQAAHFATKVTSEPPRLLRDGVEANQISFKELMDLIEQSQAAGGASASRLVDLHQKISLPFASFLFAFLALPFALRKERQADTHIGVVVCLIVAILYWFGNIAMRNLAQNDVVNPILAAWATNIGLMATAFLFVRKLDRGQ